jgi:hypothetical protein
MLTIVDPQSVQALLAKLHPLQNSITGLIDGLEAGDHAPSKTSAGSALRAEVVDGFPTKPTLTQLVDEFLREMRANAATVHELGELATNEPG